MKIILATDPVFWPLTGIGKYTLELARRLSSNPRIADIKFFNLGRWQGATDLHRFVNEKSGEPRDGSLMQKSFGFLRNSLSKSKSAVKVYSRITPFLYERRLKPFAADYK